MCTSLANILVVVNSQTISCPGEFLSKFKQDLLLIHCHKVAYIHFQRGGACNGYPGLLIVYVLVLRNHSCKLSPTIVIDGHHKVATTLNRGNS